MEECIAWYIEGKDNCLKSLDGIVKDGTYWNYDYNGLELLDISAKQWVLHNVDNTHPV